MADDELRGAEERMKGSIEALRKEFSIVRTGRANPALLERVFVDYYGTMTPMNQVANVSCPEARLIMVKPWDKSMAPKIEKAIQKADLGLVPVSDGNIIRISVPKLTEERRRELVKVVRKQAEEARVGVRNIRRETNDLLKEQERAGEITEDDLKRSVEATQRLTDRYIAEVDRLLASKEQEIMEV